MMNLNQSFADEIKEVAGEYLQTPDIRASLTAYQIGAIKEIALTAPTDTDRIIGLWNASRLTF